MPYAGVNGQRLWFQDTGGDGPVVVLGHGFLMDATMFDPQVEALRDTYRVVTWDQRGFGQTEFDSKPFTYWDSAADCLGLLDHLDVDRAVLGGMSQGGFLSLRAALVAPERVRALILLDSGATPEDPERLPVYEAMVEQWLTDGPTDELAGAVADIIIADLDESPRWIAKWRARPKEQMRQPSRCLLDREDLTDRLGEITCPALVVHGTGDTALSMEHAEGMADGLPGAGEVVQVPGAHAANLTHPQAVNEAITAFLAGLDG